MIRFWLAAAFCVMIGGSESNRPFGGSGRRRRRREDRGRTAFPRCPPRSEVQVAA